MSGCPGRYNLSAASPEARTGRFLHESPENGAGPSVAVITHLRGRPRCRASADERKTASSFAVPSLRGLATMATMPGRHRLGNSSPICLRWTEGQGIVTGSYYAA